MNLRLSTASSQEQSSWNSSDHGTCCAGFQVRNVKIKVARQVEVPGCKETAKDGAQSYLHGSIPPLPVSSSPKSRTGQACLALVSLDLCVCGECTQ